MAPKTLQILGEFIAEPSFARKFPDEVSFLKRLLSTPEIEYFEVMGRLPKPGGVLASLGLSDPHPDFYRELEAFVNPARSATTISSTIFPMRAQRILSTVCSVRE